MRKDLIEKFIEGNISEEERYLLFDDMNHDSELTDELQINLYMDEILEQAHSPEKSEENFIANLTEAIKESDKPPLATKRKLVTKKVKPIKRKAKKKAASPIPFVTITAVAACLITCFTLLTVMNRIDSKANAAVTSNLYIESVEGNINAIRNGKKTPLKNGDYIFIGDSIQAEANSHASLNYIDESTAVELKPSSVLEIKSSTDKGTEEKILVVKQGTVGFEVEKQKNKNRYIIKTDHTESTVIGTRLEVTKASNSTTVKVFEGLVRVKSLLSGHIVDIPGNHYVKVSDNTFPEVNSISGKTPKILGFSLIDASKDREVQKYMSLMSGSVLKKDRIPKEISIRINVSNQNKSDRVRTILKTEDGEELFDLVEQVIPYTMTGDKTPGEYKSWEAPAGNYVLEVTLFDKSGRKTDNTVLTFTVR